MDDNKKSKKELISELKMLREQVNQLNRKKLENEYLLNEVGKIAKIGGWEMDLRTRKAKWTQATYDIVEIGYDQPVPGPDDHINYYIPEHRHIVENAMQKLIEEDIPLDFIAQLKTARGNLKWCRALGRAVRKGEKCIRVYGTFQDITENKQAEDALIESQRKLSTLFRNMPGMAYRCLYDDQWTMLFVSEGCKHLTGYSPDDFIQNKTISYYEIIHPEDREKVSFMVGKSEKNSTKFELTYRINTRSGEIKWVWERGLRQKVDDEYFLEGVIHDITARKKAETELHISEIRFRELFNHMYSGVAVYEAFNNGEDFIIKDINRSGLLISKAKRNQVVGKRVTEVFPGVKDLGLFEVFQRVYKTGKSQKHPSSIYRDTKVSFWVENYVYKLPSGEIVAVYDDITDKKFAEEELKKSEEKYRTLFETMVQGVVYQSANGEIISANKAAERILGLTLDQMQGRKSIDPRWKAIHEDGSDFPGENHPALIALKTGKNVQNIVMGVFNPELDEYVWITVNAIPQFKKGEEKPYQVYTTFEDITESKIVNERIQKTQAKYLEIFNGSRDGFVMVDAKGKFIDANKAYCKMLGYTLEELRKKRNFYTITPKKWRKWEQEVIWKNRLMKNGFSGIYEKEYIRKDGTIIPVELQSYCVFNKKSELDYLWGVARDITDRKNEEKKRKTMEIKIQRMNTELERRVADRTADLEAFAYSVSHDLRAPLRAINGFAQILNRRHRKQLDENGQHFMDNIVQASNQMGELIDDLLQYSRLGRSAVQYTPVDLIEILERTKTLLANQIAESKGKILVKKELPTIKSDHSLLMQIFANLIENAFKYRKKEIPPQIVIDYFLKANYHEIRISDNGLGIPQKHLFKIFNVFQRLHNQDEYSGTGIGLAVVRKAVEMLEADISVQSKVNEGTTFFLKLPKKD